MEKYKILVVDDEEVIRNSLAEWLSDTGYESLTASDGPEALKVLQDADIDIMLCDLKMPGMDGMELMKKAQGNNPDLAVIIMTAYGTIASAIDAIKAGAYDYLEKPFCPERVEVLINNIMAHKKIVRENIALKKELARKYQFEELVGRSPKIQAVFELIKTVAKSNATVLIQGETGTGKELAARAVHAESLRHKGPFVSLNCAALPESLLESELFGHEKGSFTGAIAQKKGKFELANGGTIFLDEIGDISANVQVHLLRVLQEKELTRVGGNETVKVDVRVITSTNRDLKKKVGDGTFREDLFYRLNVVPILMPPLRERPDDIPILTRYFLKKYNNENNKEIRDFAPEVLDYFMKHPWSGNVRELENAVEYAVVLCRNDIIKIEHLPPLLKERPVCPPERPKSFGRAGEPQPSEVTNKSSLKDSEKQQIINTLNETKWNLTHTAKTLGISRSTLHKKLKEYQIAK